jgi:hypothetical protein
VRASGRRGRADDPLEREDLLAHGRLRVPELAGGGREGALVDDRGERAQMPDLERFPAISGSHRQ